MPTTSRRLPTRAFAAARRYAAIAPAVPHARHMPSHIYSMVGLWEDSITSNRRRSRFSPTTSTRAISSSTRTCSWRRMARRSAMIDKALQYAARGDRPGRQADFTARAAMPARYVLERADWKAQQRCRSPTPDRAWPIADALYARPRHGAHRQRRRRQSGDRGACKALRAALEKSDDSYWADRTEEQMLAVSAWVALAEGDTEQAEN